MLFENSYVSMFELNGRRGKKICNHKPFTALGINYETEID